MRWNTGKYQITAPLDNRKHRNIGVVRSAPGIKQYLTMPSNRSGKHYLSISSNHMYRLSDSLYY
jgi:hypothetical protein